MNDPESHFPHSTHDATTLKKQIASNQNYVEGNHIGNSDQAPELCFTKTLPHDGEGNVDRNAWRLLKQSIITRDAELWSKIPMGTLNGLKLVNPCASWSIELEGAPTFAVGLNPSPLVSSKRTAGEMIELYEKALCRDVPFMDYTESRKIRSSSRHLSRCTKFTGPRQYNKVTPLTIFRGNAVGDLIGPYLSQFLLHPYYSIQNKIEQKYSFPSENKDYMNNWRASLCCQNGKVIDSYPPFDSKKRYIANGRDLAWYSLEDWSYEPYLHACLIMDHWGVPFGSWNPYTNGRIKNQVGFMSGGLPDVIDLLSKATACALRAAWYHKWLVHQKLRPEELGMLIEKIYRTDDNPWNIHQELLESKTMKRIFGKAGNLLLSQVSPKGAPAHPSYPSGHAAIGGACSAILNALYEGSWKIPKCYIPSRNGAELFCYEGKPLTINTELNKLASNVAMGRNFAGIHYRSDAEGGWVLGERIACRLLEDMKAKYTEAEIRFTFYLRDGTLISI